MYANNMYNDKMNAYITKHVSMLSLLRHGILFWTLHRYYYGAYVPYVQMKNKRQKHCNYL